MSDSNLEKWLETVRQQVSQEEFVGLLLDRLDKNPDNEEREVLEVWLQVHSHQDERMVEYWRRILHVDDVRRQEQAATNLLAKCLAGNVLACQILQEFFGGEPSYEALNAWRMQRLGLNRFFSAGG